MRRVIVSKAVDPAYHLAAEEYLMSLCRPEEEILFLWQNDRTVVVGRNQNPWKECDVDALAQSGGRLVRRLSGGGAVYHDMGNLNFTFLSAMSENRVEENSGVIIKALATLGVEARFSGRNDILVGTKKVSGCAFYEEKGILCHHGTLLVNTDIAALEAALKPSVLKLQSKGIDSIRSRVINLRDMDRSITVQALMSVLCRAYIGSMQYENLLQDYLETLAPVAVRKAVYESDHWTFGESPQFTSQETCRFPWGEVEINMEVVDGVIRKAKVYTDALDTGVSQRWEEHFEGLGFEETRYQVRQLKETGEDTLLWSS